MRHSSEQFSSSSAFKRAKTALLVTTALGAAGFAGAAFAQAKPAAAPAKPAAAPAAQTPPTITATVAGVCILSRENLVGGSTVGKFVQTRLGQLTTQAQAELFIADEILRQTIALQSPDCFDLEDCRR
jgi:hypothetical protein